MTYRRLCRDKAGFILFDAILGSTLAALLVSVIAIISLDSSKLYVRAANKSDLLQIYKEHSSEFDGLLPYEERSASYEVGSSTFQISARGKWYGNDRIETGIDVLLGSSSISFTKFRIDPNASDLSGTPLCSVDFGSGAPTITSINLPINPLLPLTDLIVRNGATWIAADSATAAEPDLLVADIKLPASPLILSSINTGPGISAITMSGNYIFAAAASTAAQLHVIKMNGLASLSLSKKYQLPLPEASTSPPVGSSIFYNDKYVFLGTDRWDGQEFSIISVSNPENPSKASGFETGSKVNAIYVRKNRAYVAASDINQLRELNIANRNQPILVSLLSPPGWGRQEGRAIDHFEDEVSLGRTSGGFNIQSEKEIFISLASTTNIWTELDVVGGVYGLIIDRDHVFAATRTANQEFAVFDHGLSTSTARYYSLPVQPQTMTCDGDRLYILAKTAPVIYEIKFN